MQIAANGLAIEIDDQGPPGAEPLLLVMGLGMQLVAWPQELVQLLVARGFRVIRLDNRDAGLSQGFDEFGMPNMPLAMLRYALRLPVKSPYSIADMAGDALGVLDALGLPQAHVCGASMGGMIAQHLAAEHPQRVKSLTLMMTTSGSRKLPRPTLAVQRALLTRPANGSPEAAAERLQGLLGVIGSPAYPPDASELRARLLANARRATRPAGAARQLLAIVADGDRTPLLPRIGAPTCIIHGGADPLVPPGCGRDLAARIPGAVIDIVPGMGHDLPLPLLERFADSMRNNAARAVRSP